MLPFLQVTSDSRACLFRFPNFYSVFWLFCVLPHFPSTSLYWRPPWPSPPHRPPTLGCICGRLSGRFRGTLVVTSQHTMNELSRKTRLCCGNKQPQISVAENNKYNFSNGHVRFVHFTLHTFCQKKNWKQILGSLSNVYTEVFRDDVYYLHFTMKCIQKIKGTDEWREGWKDW